MNKWWGEREKKKLLTKHFYFKAKKNDFQATGVELCAMCAYLFKHK